MHIKRHSFYKWDLHTSKETYIRSCQLPVDYRAVCCSVLQCAVVCCSVLQRVAACCSVLFVCSLSTIRSVEAAPCAKIHKDAKRDLYTSKETYKWDQLRPTSSYDTDVKKDVNTSNAICVHQKRPLYVSKETYIHQMRSVDITRDPDMYQKRPIYKKRPMYHKYVLCTSKETNMSIKRDIYTSNAICGHHMRSWYVSKETYL